MRQFINQSNITPGLTYGDLVKGWLAEETKNDNPEYKKTIDKQFEYNRFVRDFFLHEKNKSHADVVNAWHLVKAAAGEKTYDHYRTMLEDRALKNSNK